MPNFDLNSRFNKDANFSQVVFGEDGYLLETELNEMQHIQDEARASLIREQIPSGVLNYFEPTMLPTTPNAFRLGQEMKVNVNGQILTIPKDTTITLNNPPTPEFQSVTGKVGYREDLVFLEVWKEEVTYNSNIPKFGGEGQANVTNHIKDKRVGVETTRRIQLKWRIRVVDDVNFDLFRYGLTPSNSSTYNFAVQAQGGNTVPLEETEWVGKAYLWSFYDAKLRNDSSSSGKKIGLDDYGLFLAGDGSATAKSKLNTADGYSYAIPLFKVTRRNNGRYNVNNSNGANLYELFKSITSSSLDEVFLVKGEEITLDFKELAKDLKVGDNLYRLSKDRLIGTITKISGTTLTILAKNNDGPLMLNNQQFYIWNDRPDKLYSNIIDERDLVDLRHRVSFTGFNYDELLTENIDKLLRGELRTRQGKKMLKTYHGIRKTPIDSNTVLYASFDGTSTPEVGTLSSSSKTLGFEKAPTGLGLNMNIQSNRVVLTPTKSVSTNGFTLDYFVDTKEIMNFKEYVSGAWIHYISYLRLDDESSIAMSAISSGLYLRIFPADKSYTVPRSFLDINTKYTHIRIRMTSERNIIVYVNGVKALTVATTTSQIATGAKISSLELGHNTSGWEYRGTMCDVMLSDIDRGENFATLPKDLIDGYAVVTSAFTDQRAIFSDSHSTQTCMEVIKCANNGSKHITTTKAGTNWASGDKIKIKGMCGEALTGVVDTDTAVAKCLSFADGKFKQTETEDAKKILVDDASKLKVGDVIQFASVYSKLIAGDGWGRNNSITAINGNVVTLTTPASSSGICDYIMIETTSSSSAPVLKFMNGTTPTNVTGTWTGLGTNEITFTFGSNSGLTNQNIEVQYSITSYLGDGGFTEVLDEVLCCDYNNKRLVPQSAITITDDFIGKVSGSTKENPHIIKRSGGSKSLLLPSNSSSLVEYDTEHYEKLSQSDGKLQTVNAVSNDSIIPQQVFSFNLIRMIEDKFGEIPCVDKVAWLKENVTRIACYVYGYGTCSTGNYFEVQAYDYTSNKWVAYNSPSNKHESNLVTRTLSITSTSSSRLISDDGFSHFIAFTKASDAESISSITVDYITFEIGLAMESGFVFLAPEDIRRDNGLVQPFLVKLETREIRRYQLGRTPELGSLVSYINYIPYQGVGREIVGKIFDMDKIKTDIKGYVSTLGTGAYLDSDNIIYRHFPRQLPLGGEVYDHLNDNKKVQLSPTVKAVFMKTGNVNMGSYTNYGNQIPYLVNSTTSIGADLTNRGFYHTVLRDKLGISQICVNNYPEIAGVRSNLLAFIAHRKSDGALYLVIQNKIARDEDFVINNYSTSASDIYILEGSPIIK